MKTRQLLIRLLGLLAACYATGTMTSAAWAAEAAKPPAKAAPPASESAAPKADEESSAAQSAAASKGTQEEEDAEEQQAAAKPKASGKKGSPERFVPSEQVRADFDVSFPIDI
ncbi:MAG TPA: hypothetical protein VGE08_11015 [Steroidobacter sp.]|uniref:hypothetical protein n=1 Tax=Steroidobacter sp. TaxID=1978227 RepID=UPI002EDAB1DA